MVGCEGKNRSLAVENQTQTGLEAEAPTDCKGTNKKSSEDNLNVSSNVLKEKIVERTEVENLNFGASNDLSESLNYDFFLSVVDIPLFPFESFREGLLNSIDEQERSKKPLLEAEDLAVIEAELLKNASQKSMAASPSFIGDAGRAGSSRCGSHEKNQGKEGKEFEAERTAEYNRAVQESQSTKEHIDHDRSMPDVVGVDKQRKTEHGFAVNKASIPGNPNVLESTGHEPSVHVYGAEEFSRGEGPLFESCPLEMETGKQMHRQSGGKDGQGFRYTEQENNGKCILSGINPAGPEPEVCNKPGEVSPGPGPCENKACGSDVFHVSRAQITPSQSPGPKLKEEVPYPNVGVHAQTASNPWPLQSVNGVKDIGGSEFYRPRDKEASRLMGTIFNSEREYVDRPSQDAYGNNPQYKERPLTFRHSDVHLLRKRKWSSLQYSSSAREQTNFRQSLLQESPALSQEQLFMPRAVPSHLKPPKRKRTRVEDLDPTQVHVCSLEDCRKKFAKKYNLKIHERRHRGDLPFICDQCGKKFMWYSSFTRHLKVHAERSQGVANKRVRKRRDLEKSEPFQIEKTSDTSSRVRINGLVVDVNRQSPASVSLAASLCVLNSVPYGELLENKKEDNEGPPNRPRESEVEDAKIDIIDEFLNGIDENDMDLEYFSSSFS